MTDIEAKTGTAGDAPEPRGEEITTKERSQIGLILARFFRHRLAVASLAVFLLIVGFAFVGPNIWPYDHTIARDVPPSDPPSWSHPFGTTSAGHDVMGQVMRGTQQSLKVALTVALISTAIGSLWAPSPATTAGGSTRS